jgi:hypothetical protein
MHVTFRLPYWTGMLLLAATPIAGAESPLPDPVAPAVIGRPLDQIRPARPVRQKPVAAKPARPKQVAASDKAAPKPRVPTVATAPAGVQEAPAARQMAKQARDYPAAPPTHVAGNVGSRTQLVPRAFGPGAYFSSSDQALVRKYYAMHPVPASEVKWKVGDPVPARAALTGVPDDLRAALPALPPGHQYVQLDGEVVLVAVHTRRVVDGVSRSMR